MEQIRAAIYGVVAEDRPMTVRQVFYQLVSRGVIAKTEGEYKSTVVRLLTAMRRAREIPFGWIADNTRWMRKPNSYGSLDEMLRESARLYRRSLWSNQDAYVEVWLEKDALSGVLYQETKEYDVPLMVTRGYPSLSYLHEAADAITQLSKPTYLYYFGDYDPSGLDITRVVERGLREYAADTEIHFERVAVTEQQIAALNPADPSDETERLSERGFQR